MDVLLVENEAGLAESIADALQRAGHRVALAHDGPSAVGSIGARRFDLVILDACLPGFDGYEVLARLRSARLPLWVLMLSPGEGTRDRVAGLKAGADDCLTKPVALEELLARIEVLGRRNHSHTQSDSVIQIGDLCLDVAKRRVSRAGRRVELSPREFEVLRILMREPGRVFSKEEICARIWQNPQDYDIGALAVFIMHLRRKIDCPGSPSCITTRRGRGYLLEDSPATS